METCTNCGAAVRPGAKFCTSCGTRLNPTQQQTATQSEAPAPADDQAPDPGVTNDSSAFATWGQAGSGWNTTPAGNGTASSSPTGQFEQTSDSGRETASGNETTMHYRPATWGSPKPEQAPDEDRFASWAAAYGSQQESPSAPSTGLAENTGTPDEAPEPADESVALVPMSDNGSALERSKTGTGSEEARNRATELVDELRALIWKIGLDEETGGQDENLAVILLAGARGKTGDFGDISATLDTLEKDPRDIDTLRELGAKANRIRELLESHARLTGAIDEAIRELR